MTATWHIDNDLPPAARPDWLIGAGASRAEKALMYATGLLGAALVVPLWQRESVSGWSWWQQVLALLIAADLFAGAVSNASSSTKRQYQAPLPPTAGLLPRLVHSPVAFAALHVYPFLVVLLYPGGSPGWAIGWYGGMLVAVVCVTRIVPTYLQRPSAMAIVVLSVPIALMCASPPGWDWLPFVYLAKLVLGHSVHEEAYRPGPSAARG